MEERKENDKEKEDTEKEKDEKGLNEKKDEEKAPQEEEEDEEEDDETKESQEERMKRKGKSFLDRLRRVRRTGVKSFITSYFLFVSVLLQAVQKCTGITQVNTCK